LNTGVLAAVAANAGHPAVAIFLGLGASGLAGLVVAMAWSVHVRQIRLAEQLTKRQFVVGTEAAVAADASHDAAAVPAAETAKAANGRAIPPVIIDGPETVIAGEQARYRVRTAGVATAVSWAVGGGSVSQSPDPTHPDELLMIADQPGDLTVIARAREGMHERRATKSVTALPEVTPPEPPFTLRVFLHSWGLVVIAVLVAGLAAALVALGSLSSSDFIALVVPLTALIGMTAIGRGSGEPPGRPSGKTVGS
jgi:hypothetical protein